MLIVNIDGASRGNPGDAGIGIAIYNNGALVIQHHEYIGSATNNQAEYKALKKALQLCLNLNDKSIIVLSDSELVVKQRSGDYKVRNNELKIIAREVSNLEKNYQSVIYRHVPREYNRLADKLANKAIDEYNKHRTSL